MAASTAAEARSLFRALLRESHKFASYNIRHYSKRRTIEGFRENMGLTDPQAIAAALKQGRDDLELVKRQVVIYSLYQPRVKSIMDLPREQLG